MVTRLSGSRLLYIGIAGIILVLVLLGIRAQRPQKVSISVGSAEVAVTVADTSESRTSGLSFRDKLGANEGMLFVFGEDQPYGFWMKDMRFSIDIIWFDANRRLVFVKERAEPSSYPAVFIPSTPARYVLEVPAGFFSLHKLKVGDSFEIHR